MASGCVCCRIQWSIFDTQNKWHTKGTLHFLQQMATNSGPSFTLDCSPYMCAIQLDHSYVNVKKIRENRCVSCFSTRKKLLSMKPLIMVLNFLFSFVEKKILPFWQGAKLFASTSASSCTFLISSLINRANLLSGLTTQASKGSVICRMRGVLGETGPGARHGGPPGGYWHPLSTRATPPSAACTRPHPLGKNSRSQKIS